RLISGGCRSDWAGNGQLLTRSYPDGDAWVCEAKDHGVADVAPLIAYAVGIPKSVSEAIVVSTGRQGPAARQTATGGTPAGALHVGGGCNVDWHEPGNLLVDSSPTATRWVCTSKDQEKASPASIIASEIGLRSHAVELGQNTVTSRREPHPSI